MVFHHGRKGIKREAVAPGENISVAHKKYKTTWILVAGRILKSKSSPKRAAFT